MTRAGVPVSAEYDFGTVFGVESILEPPVKWADYDHGYADDSPPWQKDRVKFWRAVKRRNQKILRRLVAAARKANAQCDSAARNYNARIASAPREEIAVRRIRLNAGGYAPDGVYFGGGEKVWRFEAIGIDSAILLRFTRAASKAAAKQWFTRQYPGLHPVWR